MHQFPNAHQGDANTVQTHKKWVLLGGHCNLFPPMVGSHLPLDVHLWATVVSSQLAYLCPTPLYWASPIWHVGLQGSLCWKRLDHKWLTWTHKFGYCGGSGCTECCSSFSTGCSSQWPSFQLCGRSLPRDLMGCYYFSHLFPQIIDQQAM